MLAATMGVDEVELLRNAQKGKEQLDQFLLSKLEDKQLGAQMLERNV